jgi:hypothetical protein
MLFCLVYYKEYEQKSDAERKEQIVQLTVNEMQKEVSAVKRSEQEIQLIRHDMCLMLGNLSVCISNDDKETAKKMIAGYIDSIDQTVVRHYCTNTTLNYIISSFADKCRKENTDFVCSINTDNIYCDEILLSSIISNAMDNAINAQQNLPPEKRKISLMLKEHSGRLLLLWLLLPWVAAIGFINADSLESPVIELEYTLMLASFASAIALSINGAGSVFKSKVLNCMAVGTLLTALWGAHQYFFGFAEMRDFIAEQERNGVYIAPEIKAQAQTLWSLSKLTFPHEIARLLLCEQLYRAMNIAQGGSYHHV